jgi:hypothetical protein
MNYLHFIPHVNRIDLTSIALNSVRNLWSSTVIIDNSEQSEFSQFSSQKNQFHIITPPVPLNTAQTLNFIRKIAIEKQLDFITFMHNDCEVLTDNGDLMMLDCASTVFKENNEIGFIKYNNMINGTASNDDLFCAFKTEMLIDVGSWDWICFPYYFLDTDYFQRMTNKGWKTFTIDNLECKHHSDSNTTVKNDVIRKISNPYFYVASNQLMDIKWNDYYGNWDNLKDD